MVGARLLKVTEQQKVKLLHSFGIGRIFDTTKPACARDQKNRAASGAVQNLRNLP